MVGTRSSFLLASAFLGAGLVLGWYLDAVPPQGLLAQTSSGEEQSREERYARLDEEAALLERHSRVLRTVVKLSSPFVVHIEAQKSENPRAPRGRMVEEAGSGIIFMHQRKYFVLTNRHVVKDAANENITIKLDDGRELHPLQIRSDADTDIAVMTVEAAGLTPARLGNSDLVEIGDYVLAMGSPFGLSRSVTHGIVSAKGRRDLDLGGETVRYQDFLQTDAAINPGNSGGPLLNLRGEVVGMNTAIASSSGGNEGIGFAIPINMAMVVARQLVERGVVARAYLGVNLDARFSAADAAALGLSRKQGARITTVTPKSPAAQAGLAAGDVVIEFNHVVIEDDAHLINQVSLTPVHSEVPLVIFRNGQSVKLTVKVGDRQALEQK